MDAPEQATSPKSVSLPAEIRTMIWRWAVRPTHLTLFCAYDHGMLERDDITWDELDDWTSACDHVFLGKKIARTVGCVKRLGRPVAYFVASPPPVYRVCRESCALLRKHYALNPAATATTTTTTTTMMPLEFGVMAPPSEVEMALPPWFDLHDDVIQLLYHDLNGLFAPGAPLRQFLLPVRHLRIAMHRSLWQRVWSQSFKDTVVSSERLLRDMHALRYGMPYLRDVTFVVAGRGPDPFWAGRTAVHVAHWCDVFEYWCVARGGGRRPGVKRGGPLWPPARSVRVVARHEDGTEEEWLTLDNFLCVLHRQLQRELPTPGPGQEEMLEQQAMLENYYPKYRDILRATEEELENPFAFLKAHQELWHPPGLRLPFDEGKVLG